MKYKGVRIYVAGKLNDAAVDYNNNRSKMMHVALQLHNSGYSVFVPCMIEQLSMLDVKDWNYEDYFQNSWPWLSASDALFLVSGWETSKGTLREIKEAKRLNIPIFENISDLHNHFIKEEIYE